MFRIRNGKNIRAWIEFDGSGNEINIIIGPVGMHCLISFLINFRNSVITKCQLGLMKFQRPLEEYDKVAIGLLRSFFVMGTPSY